MKFSSYSRLEISCLSGMSLHQGSMQKQSMRALYAKHHVCQGVPSTQAEGAVLLKTIAYVFLIAYLSDWVPLISVFLR